MRRSVTSARVARSPTSSLHRSARWSELRDRRRRRTQCERRAARARAEDEERVRADPPPRRIRARRVWEDALVSREQLIFALRVVVDEIAAALAADGLAALRIAVRLEREDADALRLERAILPPTRESAALLRSLRWTLEERAHLGRIVSCVVDVREVEPARGRQIGLFAAEDRKSTRLNSSHVAISY